MTWPKTKRKWEFEITIPTEVKGLEEHCFYDYNCVYCQDTGTLPGGTICDACHCRGCGELIKDCYCGSGWNIVYCPQCSAPLGPNGTSEKCTDCGYGY